MSLVNFTGLLFPILNIEYGAMLELFGKKSLYA
jgi:hypothetical protein